MQIAAFSRAVLGWNKVTHSRAQMGTCSTLAVVGFWQKWHCALRGASGDCKISFLKLRPLQILRVLDSLGGCWVSDTFFLIRACKRAVHKNN